MATERVDIVINPDTGAKTVRKDFEDLGRSARDTAKEVYNLDSYLKGMKGSANQVIGGLSSATGSVKYLTGATTSASTSIAQMGAAVASAGGAAGGAAPPLKNLGAAAGGASGGFNNLSGSIFTFRNALRATLSILFLRELKEFTDQWIYFENNVRLSTSSVMESQVVLTKLYEATMRARVEMEPMILLYRRAAQAGKELGASQQQLIDFTEGVGKALTVQGVSMKQAHGTLLQLGQMIGMARIRAQEFNSINENAPRILQAVADNLNIASGSIHKLRLAMNAQKVTNQELFQAFMKGVKQINEEFANVRPTFEQAFAVLKTGFGRWLYDINKATGASTLLTRAIIWVGNNFDKFAKILITSGTLILGLFSVKMATAITASMTSAIASIGALLGPLGLVTAAIGAVIAILTIWKDDIVLIESEHVTLGDYMRATWNVGSRWIQDATKSIGAFLNTSLTIKDVVSTIGNAFRALWDAVKTIMNGIIGLLNGFVKAVGGSLELIYVSIEAFLSDIANIIDKVLKGEFDFDIRNSKFIKTLTSGASTIEDSLKAAFKKDYIGDWLDAGLNAFNDLITNEARFIAWTRTSSEAAADLGKKLGSGIGAGDISLDKLRRDFERLIQQIAPAENVITKITHALDLLRRARAAGIVTTAREEQLTELLFEHYHKLLNPIESLRAEIAEEARYVLMDRDARSANNRVMEEEAKLRTIGLPITEATREEIRREVDELYRLKRVSQEVENIREKLIGPRKKFIESEAALNLLYAQGTISLQEYAREFIELRNAAEEGDFASAMTQKIQLLTYTAKKSAQDIGRAFGDLFNQLIQGFGDSIGRAIVFADDLRTALYSIASQALASLISALVQVGIRLALNAMIGEGLATAAIAASSAQAAALAVAWSTPAALASLATVGTNAGPAAAALTGTVALAEMLAAGSATFAAVGGGIGAGIGAGGFEEGGFTGYSGRKQVAGFVHGQEFVMNAEATARHRPILESMNKGGVAPGVKITVNNYSSAKIEVQQITPTDIRIIAREEARKTVMAEAPNVVANDIANPNGRVSTSLARNTAIQRRRS